MAKRPASKRQLIPTEVIERRIYLIRGHKVMLDSDLADLYQVETKALNQAVKRNQDRFPQDFMFRLGPEEARGLGFHSGASNVESLRSQIVTSRAGRGGRRYLAYAFTEQGVAMLSSVLNSKRAVQVNIAIMRTFVRLRQILATHKDLAAKLEAMEQKYDQQFKVVFEILRELMEPPRGPEKGRIGFVTRPET
jgi:ORF6N domain